MTTPERAANDRISAFSREMQRAGDVESVEICNRALAGDSKARSDLFDWFRKVDADRARIAKYYPTH